MPAAKAASSAANSSAATGRGTKGLEPDGAVPLPVVGSDLVLGSEVVTDEVPPAAASLTGEVRGRPRCGPYGDEHDEDTGRDTRGAEDALARDVEDVRDARADVVGGRLGHARLSQGLELRRRLLLRDRLGLRRRLLLCGRLGLRGRRLLGKRD